MNPIIGRIPPSVIRELHGQKRPTSIDLGLGEPTLRPDTTPLHEALDWVEQNGCPYSPNPGYLPLREAIARHYSSPQLTHPYDATQVCLTVGSQEALYVALKALLDPTRDEALIITPAYPLYAKLCQMDGVPVREVGLDPARDFAPDADRVLSAVTENTRVLVLASPGNPGGRIWPEGELRRLADGLAAMQQSNPDRGSLYIVSDEVYRELYFTESPPPPPRSSTPIQSSSPASPRAAP